LGLVVACATHGTAATNVVGLRPFAGRAEVQEYIRLMVSTNGFKEAALTRMFSQVASNPALIEAMKTPGTIKPWPLYRTNFLNPHRIAGGADFVRSNAVLLAEVQRRYGVPPEMVAAILAIETDCGRFPLRYKAVESLATLGFDYPPRSNYFRGELTQFLLLAREQGWDPLTVPSSRDGGLGVAQFMPRSYRRIAIDFDGDGRRNLLVNGPDACGSIGNYLSLDGWRRGDGLLAVPAQATGTNFAAEIRQVFPAPKTGAIWRVATDWKRFGITPTVEVPADRGMLLIELEGEKEPERWLVCRNFNVITGYNHNPKYALAAGQLAVEIHRAVEAKAVEK
jgi:membrane-bound lytic murein transglycosylase B